MVGLTHSEQVRTYRVPFHTSRLNVMCYSLLCCTTLSTIVLWGFIFFSSHIVYKSTCIPTSEINTRSNASNEVHAVQTFDILLVPSAIASTVAKIRLALIQECIHSLLLICGGKQSMEETPLKT